MSRRPAIGRDGKASADHFAEGAEVGLDVVELLGASGGDAEAGHHFVEDQKRAVLLRDVAEGFEEAGLGRDAAHVARRPVQR